MGIVHSVYGASSSKRWLICPASIRMSEGRPEESDEFSELGTAAHELGEFCLKTGLNAYECIGLMFNDVEVDSEMVEAVQLYVSYVRDLCRKYNVEPMLEKQVVMTSVRNDVFGTSDCIIIVGDWLFVIDYKHGYNVVEVANNSQAIHYAISTLDTFNLWQSIKHVHTSIVQPHSYHIDGSIRSHTYDVNELPAWRERFRNAIAIAEAGSTPVAGDHCENCPAMARCKARFMRTIELVFNNGDIEIEPLIALYQEMSLVKKHLEAVDKEVTEFARQGGKVDGFKLVKSTPRAKCVDEEGFVKTAMFLTGRPEEDFYNRKLKGKGDCVKLVNDEYTIKDYFKRPEASGTKLVPMSDNKPAISVGSAQGLFTNVAPVEKPSAAGIFTGIQ